MALALLSIRQAERVEPKLKQALEEGLSARERLERRDGKSDQQQLSARQFVTRLDARAQALSREQMAWALGRIDPKELDATITHLAKLRGRYATLSLEYTQGDRPIRGSSIAELREMREQITEIEFGLETLKAAILDGTLEVAGVKMAE